MNYHFNYYWIITVNYYLLIYCTCLDSIYSYLLIASGGNTGIISLVDKPQVYFVDIGICVNEMTHLALPTAWNARRPSEPAHLNSVRNLIPPTDWPTNRPRTLDWPSAQGTRVLHREADWSRAPVKGHFDEFHNQWLSHWHRCQIADLFNSRNITSLNH